ncbi:MAG: hypothetical protein Kow0059_04270 [Candidatus Sumerlaeia bacterium]
MFLFFFPYAVDEPIEKRPVVTYTLLAVNWIVFVFLYLTPFGWANRGEIVRLLGYVPGEWHLWALITHVFLHGGLFHILGNTVYLFLFGPYLEQKLGRLSYIGFYLAGAAASSLTHHVFTSAPSIPLVGASGAISALLGAFFCLRPWSDVRNFFIYWIFLYVGSYRVNIPALLYFPVFFLFQNFVGASVEDVSQGVAYWAHLGGFFFGFGLMLGLYGFTGWNEEREPELWLRKRAREKRLKTATKETFDAQIKMTSRMDAADILQEVVRIADPGLMVTAYHRAMARYPDLMLAPGIQERMAALMESGGYLRDALHAYEKLIVNVPRSAAGQRAFFASGKICARLPEFHERGRRYLREFLDNIVPAEQRLEAERLIKSIEEAIRARGGEPEPLRPLSPLPGTVPAIDPSRIPRSLRPPAWDKTPAAGEPRPVASVDAEPPKNAPPAHRADEPKRTVVGVAASEAPTLYDDMTFQAPDLGSGLEFPDLSIPSSAAAEASRQGGADQGTMAEAESGGPAPAGRSAAGSSDEPAASASVIENGVIPTSFQKTTRSIGRVKRPVAVERDKPFAPPDGAAPPAKRRHRGRISQADGLFQGRSDAGDLIVALPRHVIGDREKIEVFLARLWRCNRQAARERLLEARGILLRNVNESAAADAERLARQEGVPLLIVRAGTYPDVRQPVDISSMTINESGALILSAGKRHHIKWEDVALLSAAALRHGRADGSAVRVLDMICLEAKRSYRAWGHIGWFSVAPDTTRIRFQDGFDRLLRKMRSFAPDMELAAGLDLEAGEAPDQEVHLPEFGMLKDYNQFLEWHAVQFGSRLYQAD